MRLDQKSFHFILRYQNSTVTINPTLFIIFVEFKKLTGNKLRMLHSLTSMNITEYAAKEFFVLPMIRIIIFVFETEDGTCVMVVVTRRAVSYKTSEKHVNFKLAQGAYFQ